jgi:hypothetical protein
MRFPAVLIIALFSIAEALAQSSEYPPPGRMVDIGGRKLHLNCTGNGSPTVVLVAGGGAYSIDWALVQIAVAEKVRT